jgi:hypothetical protein
VDGEPRALGMKGRGEYRADAARRAGHEHDSIGERQCGWGHEFRTAIEGAGRRYHGLRGPRC